MTSGIRHSYRGKRAFDLVCLAAAAVPAGLVGLACALAVKATSPGPVFFVQERVGVDGRSFRLYKFRTMVHADDNPVFPDPDRITAVGRVLRRLSLDEVPQLLNVARGDMSMVGPRPTLPYQVARYDDRQRQRLAVRPGVTGLAQVAGRNSMPWADRIELDIRYVQDQSLLLDMAILGRTFAAVLRGSGVEGHPADDPLARPPD